MEVADTRPGVNLNFGGDVDVGRDMQVADRGGRTYGGHQEQRGYQGWPRYPDRGSWGQDQPADAAEERGTDRPPYPSRHRYR